MLGCLWHVCVLNVSGTVVLLLLGLSGNGTVLLTLLQYFVF